MDALDEFLFAVGAFTDSSEILFCGIIEFRLNGMVSCAGKHANAIQLQLFVTIKAHPIT